MVPTKRQKSNKNNDWDALVSHTREVLQDCITRDDHLIAGLSGGVDSIVLLDLLALLSRQMQFTLSAVHVNHGISHNANAWSHFCCRLCYTYGISISVAYLKVSKQPGLSLEAVAREKRYQVFSRLHTTGATEFNTSGYLVLAQHQDDQAETVLLQLLRGAGVRGLSAMPRVRKQSVATAPYILRPLLDVSRSSIESYAAQRQLQWVHDESNDCTHYSRNFLRHEVLPVIRRKYPNYSQTLQRTSQHMAEASQLLDELAKSDAQRYMADGKLAFAAMRELSDPRAKNLLRYLLWQQNIRLPSTIRLEELLRQLQNAESDTRLHVKLGTHEVRVYRGDIFILPIPLYNRKPPKDLAYAWQDEPSLVLNELGGTISFKRSCGQGLSHEKLKQAPVFIRLRKGGETFKPDCKRPRRSLKNLLQEASIPPWTRYTLPLLFCGEKLAWVPGIGMDCEFQAMPDENGVVPEWQAQL